METTKRKRTREEVRAAFREYLDDKKKRMEEKQRELEEIHEMRMSGMTMEEIKMDGQMNFVAIISRLTCSSLPQAIEEFSETISLLFDIDEKL